MPETSCPPRADHGHRRGRCHGGGCAVHQAGSGQGGRLLRHQALHHQPALPGSRGRPTSSSTNTSPKECTDEMVCMAIERFKNRTAKSRSPTIKNMGVHGFSHEYINYMLGGTFRASYTPAERQHHQRPHPRGCRSGRLHQPARQAGLGARRAGQGADQERRPGGADRLLADRPGQGRADDARGGRTGRARAAGSVRDGRHAAGARASAPASTTAVS